MRRRLDAGTYAVAAIAVGLVALVGGHAASASARPAVTVTPARGAPGTPVIVRGRGFARGAAGFVVVERRRVGAIHTNARGRFAKRFLAPHAAAGRLAVTVIVRVGPVTARGRPRRLQRAATGFDLVAPPARSGAICRSAPVPATYDHVIWIAFENQSYGDVIGKTSSQPFVNELAGRCGLATNFFPERHPSLPNYIAMTSGDTQGVTGDSSGPLNVDNIYNQVKRSGRQWRQYAFGMPSNCAKSDFPSSSKAVYTAHHQAAIYYTNLAADCPAWDVAVSPGKVDDVIDVTTSPLAKAIDANVLPAFTVITPSDDGGNSSLGGQVDPKLGDPFLRRWVGRITSSAAYRAGRTAIFVTWDEGSDFGASPTALENIPMLVIAPSVPRGARSAMRFDHYAMLRTTEELLGIRTFLGNAARAPSMRSAFNL